MNNVVAELGSEKIDIIKYSDDPAEYVAASLPADVVSVLPLEDTKSCRVVVPDDQLSLAIGKEGQMPGWPPSSPVTRLTSRPLRRPRVGGGGRGSPAGCPRSGGSSWPGGGIPVPGGNSPETPPRPPARSHPRPTARADRPYNL
ncbi:MAG: hypothetical protein ACLSF6_03515 [Evtepia gabavorous]